MGDPARQAVPNRPENIDEVRVRVALVQEHWLADLGGELELPAKGLPLRIARGEIAKEIEPALADGHDLAVGEQCPQRRQAMFVELRRVMRVHAGRGPEPVRPSRGQGCCLDAAGDRRTRHDEPADACRRGAAHDLGAVIVEAVVREIGADIDQIEHGLEIVTTCDVSGNAPR